MRLEQRAEGSTTPIMNLCALSQSSLKPNPEKKCFGINGLAGHERRVDPGENRKGKSE